MSNPERAALMRRFQELQERKGRLSAEDTQELIAVVHALAAHPTADLSGERANGKRGRELGGGRYPFH